MNRRTRTVLKRGFFSVHRFLARRGVHLIPAHYYSAVPDIRELEKRNSWRRRSEMPGIAWDLDEQAASLRAICKPYQREYAGNTTYLAAAEGETGPGFGYIEAQALHGFIRHHAPERVVEVGSGVSTRCTLAALALNKQETGKAASITCIEPHPYSWLRETAEVTLIHSPVQECSMDVFTQLDENDLLFIDSSHAAKPGADVNFVVLEVLPRLRLGVLVHFHDIYFPFDYPRDLMKTFLYGGGESSLVHAFLINNTRASIVFALSMLHYDRPDVLKEVFPEYVHQAGDDGLVDPKYKAYETPAGHFPSSLYLRML